MIKTSTTVFAVAVLFVIGAALLASGAHLLSVASLLAGMALLIFRGNAILDRGRQRRGKPETWSMSVSDLGALTGHDWAEFAVVMLLGVVLTIVGVATTGAT